MQFADNIEDTFLWFVLTVEAGIKNGFPKDINKRIEWCKKELDEYKISKLVHSGEEINDHYGHTCSLCGKPRYQHRESDMACPDYGIGGRFSLSEKDALPHTKKHTYKRSLKK